MPTHDRADAVTEEQVRELVARTAFTPAGGSAASDVEAGAIGLEPELFPYRVDASGRPSGRLPLATDDKGPGSLEILGALAARHAGVEKVDNGPGTPPEFLLASGGRLTFEPGGQIEHSTAPYTSGSAAQKDTLGVFCTLREAFRAHGVELASTGIDLFETAATVPQQLDAPRYRAMEAYFASRGPFGATMMRLTASQQLNLDLGDASTIFPERWKTAQLASPIVTAAFSASPHDGWANGRARAWQELDPTRSGFPALFVDGTSDDPVEQYTQAVLDADVMLVRDGDEAHPGRAGFRFRDWIETPHAAGYPTLDDAQYHLTTLFLEVRPRGFLELRACDALPPPWSTAPTVLITGMLYDPKARGAVLERLGGQRASLPELWRRAARAGLSDPELGRLAPEVLEIALEGAHRLPLGWFAPDHLETAERFLETFTRRGFAPADALAQAIGRGSADALRWAAGDADCASALERGIRA